MKFWAQIGIGGIHPLHNSDDEELRKLKLNTDYKFTVTKPRNYEYHKKFFALLNLAYDNQEHFNNFDEMRAWLTMSAGFYKRVITPSGEMFQPESISFANKDEIEFNEIYQRVMDEICKWLDLTDEAIQEQVINFM